MHYEPELIKNIFLKTMETNALKAAHEMYLDYNVSTEHEPNHWVKTPA
jgi:hypothetical protein